MSNNIIDTADKKVLDQLNDCHNEMKGVLVKLLMTEVELEAARGHPERFRKYRKSVLEWMRDNVDDKGKRKHDDNQEYFKVEFEFERKKKKRKRVAYPAEPVKIPQEILQAAYLSGSSNRLSQTHAQDVKVWDQGIDPFGPTPFEKVIQDSNRISGMQRLK